MTIGYELTSIDCIILYEINEIINWARIAYIIAISILQRAT